MLQGEPGSGSGLVAALRGPVPEGIDLTWQVLIDFELGMALNLAGLTLGVRREKHLRSLFRQWDREPVGET